MTDHKQNAREPKTTYEKHVTSLPCGCERMTFDRACEIRDQLAPIGSHTDHFMARWGWHPAETRVDTDYVYPCDEHRRPNESAEKAEPNTVRRVGSTDLCGKHLVNAEACGCEPMPLVLAPESAKPDSMSAGEIAKPMGCKIEVVPVYCCSCLADVTAVPYATHECKPGAVGYAKYGNVITTVYPTLRDAICKLCGKTGGEHAGVNGCPSERKGFEFL